jgi:hypothetical protein
MLEKNGKRLRSRREFLKQTCKTGIYVIPLVTVLKLGSHDAWAQSYGNGGRKEFEDGHMGFFERIFRAIAHIFY